MAISEEKEAAILRYHHVEKWRVGTIARQLNVHHSVVTRVLKNAGVAKKELRSYSELLEPYLDFVLTTLEKYPTLTASRLYQMVIERGYAGGPDHFRYLISLHRPKRKTEAYLRLKTLPGEQGQVDWGHFGYIEIGKARRPLMAFVMVLSYSRKVFLQFYLNQRQANFLHGHESAFTLFGGIPKVLLYDNLKSVVLDRQGDAIRYHPNFLNFAGHYRFEPRPVAPARGNEKGRVERSIRYIRDNFFAGRTWSDLTDLNHQARQWCDGPAAQRPCPGQQDKTVEQCFNEEREQLINLPDNPYPCDERENVTVAKTPYVRFDLNDYSVPHQYVRQTLTLLASTETVRIIDGAEEVACHSRCYGRREVIENESHIQALAKYKKKSRMSRGQHRLTNSAASAEAFLREAGKRGYVLRTIVHELIGLLDLYGAERLEQALVEALARDVPHPNAVRLTLQRIQEETNQPPPLAVALPDDSRVKSLTVKPHKLSDYDQLNFDHKDHHHDER